MPTSNPTITADWGKLVDVGEDFTLGFPPGPHQPVAVAAVDTDSAPLVEGEILTAPAPVLNRARLGAGFIFARSLTAASVPAWLHTWHGNQILFTAGLWDNSALWLTDRIWS